MHFPNLTCISNFKNILHNKYTIQIAQGLQFVKYTVQWNLGPEVHRVYNSKGFGSHSSLLYKVGHCLGGHSGSTIHLTYNTFGKIIYLDTGLHWKEELGTIDSSWTHTNTLREALPFIWQNICVVALSLSLSLKRGLCLHWKWPTVSLITLVYEREKTL